MIGFQSLYRKHHSTESILNIQMISQIWLKGLLQSSLFLISLPLYIIEQNILFKRLHTFYEISELALGWFKSYLLERTHLVKVGNTLSHPAEFQFGIPQGFVLGPILFSLFTNLLSSIIHSYNSIKCHFYTDDTQ